ncbi:MAG: hypothetical protein IKD83_01140 [Firmicutes bacterium]|nr:hypothetical protein [Bacillota bacterium]
MKRIYSTTNYLHVQKIQEVFSEKSIAYKIKFKNFFNPNIFDYARLGSLGNNDIVITYIFYVKKNDIKEALRLIKTSIN